MACKCLAALAADITVLARTPAGFKPASETDLIVENPTRSNNLPVTTSEPRIGTLTRLNGTSYAVMMIDLDIPTDNPPKTNTLLHWMQTGLTPSTTATQLDTSSGTMQVFLLHKNNQSNTTAIVPYFSPNPPARIALSHRYTQILVDTSGLTEEGTEVLRTAATTRRGFDAEPVLERAGLEGRIVAGNSYNVTNPGPVSVTNGTAGNGAAGGAGAIGTGAVVGNGPSQTAWGCDGWGGGGWDEIRRTEGKIVHLHRPPSVKIAGFAYQEVTAAGDISLGLFKY
ncbi:hypothetical protein N657DRAFT_653867 [Parathielavia appendiculata]|uniref:Uncharacterized protein n=1 Tax=Parathielavia appendiculata TaxID=2587402 RepID=A0AAN6Z7B9_9PEZI|nr:hypothetical protein N657DRAFT_653867 [Parathielavia appendiculata]